MHSLRHQSQFPSPKLLTHSEEAATHNSKRNEVTREKQNEPRNNRNQVGNAEKSRADKLGFSFYFVQIYLKEDPTGRDAVTQQTGTYSPTAI